MAIKIISRPVKGIIAVMIIAVALGSLSLFWSSWSGLIAFSASMGGMVAFLGLWMEKEADDEEKKEHLSNFVGEKHFTKLKSEIGWYILMVGILIEVATAGVFAANDAIENNKNKPENQPIRAISAQVFLEIRGTNFDERILSQPEPQTMASFGFFNKTRWLANLGCEKYISVPIRLPELSEPSDRNPNERLYSMSFNWDSGVGGSIGGEKKFWSGANNVSLKQLEKEMIGVDIGVPGMKGGMKIVRGTCEVLFNGSIQRKFSIPEYTSDSILECFPTKN